MHIPSSTHVPTDCLSRATSASPQRPAQGHRSRSRASDSRITQITITSPAVAEARAASLPRARWTSYGASRGWLSGLSGLPVWLSFPAPASPPPSPSLRTWGGMSVAAVVVPRSLGMHRQHSTHPRLGLGRASEGWRGRTRGAMHPGLRATPAVIHSQRAPRASYARQACCLPAAFAKKYVCRLQPSMLAWPGLLCAPTHTPCAAGRLRGRSLARSSANSHPGKPHALSATDARK